MVGNFLRDGESNYLEGALCIMIYMIIAVAAYYFPNDTSVFEEVKTEAAGIVGQTLINATLVNPSIVTALLTEAAEATAEAAGSH